MRLLKEKSTLDIVTAEDLLSVTKLQLPGKKIISAKDFFVELVVKIAEKPATEVD